MGRHLRARGVHDLQARRLLSAPRRAGRPWAPGLAQELEQVVAGESGRRARVAQRRFRQGALALAQRDDPDDRRQQIVVAGGPSWGDDEVVGYGYQMLKMASLYGLLGLFGIR